MSAQPQKSKADLRRERAAIQEAQRAKKAAEQAPSSKQQPAQSVQKPKQIDSSKNKSEQAAKSLASNVGQAGAQNEKESAQSQQSANLVFETAPVTLKLSKKKPDSSENLNENETNKSKLFHHFEQYKRDYSIVDKLPLDAPQIHPAFIKLGLQLAHDVVLGSNARCIAFLYAFKKFLHDFKHNESKAFTKDLETKLKHNIKLD